MKINVPMKKSILEYKRKFCNTKISRKPYWRNRGSARQRQKKKKAERDKKRNREKKRGQFSVWLCSSNFDQTMRDREK